MASKSFDLTTYYAKRIIGDTAAEDADKALLQTGANINTNTWILYRTIRGSTNPYGIIYTKDTATNGTADKIEFYGNGTSTAWIQLDTGDSSFNSITLEGLTASRAVATDSNKKLISVDLSVTDANASPDNTTTFVQAVTQSSTGKITVTKAALNTSGTWSGTASKATTTADTTNTLYLVGVTSGATTTLKRDTSITIKGENINTGTWNATTIAVNKGGTGLTSYTKGDILYASAGTTLSKLAIGTAGYVLYATENGPSWYDQIVLTSTDCTIDVPITCTESIYSEKRIAMQLPSADITAANNGLSSDVERNFMAQDKNGKNYAFHGSIAKADGTVVASFGVKNYDINNNAQYSWRGITVYQAKNGTVGYTVSATPAFRTAIGLGSTANDQYKFLMSNGTNDPVWRAAFNISSGDTIPELADESDLDEITDPSVYCVRNSTHMKTILHNPHGTDAASGGRIITMGGYSTTANSYQWQFVFMSSGAPIFRNRANTSWNDWRTFVTHPTREAIGDATTPVYVNANGYIQKCTVGAEGYPLVGTGTNSSPVWYSGLTATGTQASDWKVTIKGTSEISTSDRAVGALVVNGGASFASAIRVNGWIRTFGDNGWYSQTHGGGLCMRDDSYVRMYGKTQFLITTNKTASDETAASNKNLSSQLIISSLAHSTTAAALDTTPGGAVAIELWRGSNASWQIVNDGGTLKFRNNYTTARQSTYSVQSLSLAYNTGDVNANGSIWAGILDDTSREIDIGVRSGAGDLYMYSVASSTGSRGLYVHAHGNGSAKNIINIDKDNEAAFYGAVDLNDERSILGRIKRKKDGTGGWAYTPLRVYDNANTDFAHFGVYGSANTMNYIYIGANDYNGNNLRITPEGTVTLFSQLTISGTTTGGVAADTTNPKITFVEGASTQPVHLIYTDQNSYRSPAGLKVVGGASATPAWFEVEGLIYSGDTSAATERSIYAVSNSGTVAVYSTGNPSSNGNRGLWFSAHGAGESIVAVSADTDSNVQFNARGKGPLYLLKSVGEPWPYIRFDTADSYEGDSYTTTVQTGWSMLYCQVPAKKVSDNTYYSAQFFFRVYSKTANTTTRINHYETYFLPAATDGLSTNPNYNILTEKNTVTVAQGGTGASSFTANSVIMSGSTTTSALTTRSLLNNTSVSNLGWSSSTGNGTYILTANSLAYWNGRYNSSSSNLTYCKVGEFGTIITTDYPTSSTNTVFLRGDGTWTSTLAATYVSNIDGARYIIKSTHGQSSSATVMFFGENADGTTQGIYSYGYRTSSTAALTSDAKYLIYRNSAGNIYVNGNADTATKAYVTVDTPGAATNYLIWNTGTSSGNQSLKSSSTLYFYGGTTHYLVIGNSSTSGGLTMRNANGKYVDIVTSAFASNKTLTIPDVTATIFTTAGGTLSGNLKVYKAGDTYVEVKNTDKSCRLELDINGNGQQGLWSDGYWNGSAFVSSNLWMIYRNAVDGLVTVNGTANIANYLTSYVSEDTNTSTRTIISALKNKFADIPKSVGTATRIQIGSHYVGFGYYLGGTNYNTVAKAYGGWFVAAYDTPHYVGISNGTWTDSVLIHSNNYTSYTVTKTGSGASGSWGISITGSAAKIADITTTDAASSSSTWRNVWISYNDNTTGRPAYDTNFAYQTSTGQLKFKEWCVLPYGGTYGTGGNGLIWFNGTSGVTQSGEVANRIRCNKDFQATKVYNAVWNDYAECRAVETEEPGYCVTESSMGKMIKTYERLQAGCKITSDTFGTCMGQTEEAKTPIAVAGRVLVYPYRDRSKYKLGAAVCSAPGGTIDIMTRDEIMMYPERIVGTVSEIPTYEIWHGGDRNNPADIQVNGRIWIYVR